MDSRQQQASDLLWQHWQNGSVFAALPDNCKPVTLAEGYAIQAHLLRRTQQPLFGYKIGATSIAGQKHIGVDGPIAGRLLAERVLALGTTISLHNNRMRVAECEVAFVMGNDLPPRDAAYEQVEVMKAVAAVHPAIEIPDSRFERFELAGAPQLLADNACAHQFMLGKRCTANWRSLDFSQLAITAIQTHASGERVVHHGSGSNVLGDPRIVMVWLANLLSSQGTGLKAGQVITTGTCVVPIPLMPGDRIEASYGVVGDMAAAFE
jgi:2-keto-4-pentenoate hydratase